MEALSALIATLDQLFIHTAYCIAQPTTSPECGSFWSWAIVGCFTLGSLAIVFLVLKGTSYSIQVYAAQLVPLEPGRALAEDPLGHLRWAGSPALASGPPEDELEACIRAAFSQLPAVEPVHREEVLSKAA